MADKSKKNSSKLRSKLPTGTLNFHDFAIRLRSLREEKGFTQQEMARKVGVSMTTIQNYEGGQLPKGEHAVSLAVALECSLDWLMLGIAPTGITENEELRNLRQENDLLRQQVQDLRSAHETLALAVKGLLKEDKLEFPTDVPQYGIPDTAPASQPTAARNQQKK